MNELPIDNHSTINYSLIAALLVIILQCAAVWFFHKPHRKNPGLKLAVAGHQNLFYLINAISISIPALLMIYLHFVGDFLDVSDIALVTSLLMLFMGALFPVMFVRVFKPSISAAIIKSPNLVKKNLIDESEQRANLWSELFLAAGSITAILATLYVGYNNEISHFAPIASTKCLGLLRDYAAPPLHPTIVHQLPQDVQQKNIREACANMR